MNKTKFLASCAATFAIGASVIGCSSSPTCDDVYQSLYDYATHENFAEYVLRDDTEYDKNNAWHQLGVSIGIAHVESAVIGIKDELISACQQAGKNEVKEAYEQLQGMIDELDSFQHGGR